ncbi:GNAT family N-acetyltransferase [Pontixanthobacter aquaemixtae]|uniref:GNAT family N-acetyltransferase n=1 Tax=Pontixanthobacter aquaemixtae TaxID=1958940 RepID=A0A844ZT44_9SPHN|nr:GNAT family N-acetyltransferase [Pontixanthobacter aquaemixtae]MXO90176.1 GNAT family N-acetyltransferase [Pontixanthobacter aquaemixtae]
MSYRIRDYVESDAGAIHSLTLAAINTVGRAGYSQEQVDAWAARHGDAERLHSRVLSGHMVFVAVDAQDRPVAYALLEPDGHLDMLYCHPRHTRRGLADQLLDTAESQARSLGVERLYTEASELARPAFERAGYELVRRRDFDLDGVPIHNFAMEKRLGQLPAARD